MAEHVLKVCTEYWDAIASGEKNFEVRRDDRGFQKGDILVLRPFDRVAGRFTELPSFCVRRKIAWILTGGQLGIEPGYVVMALRKA